MEHNFKMQLFKSLEPVDLYYVIETEEYLLL